MAIPITLPRFGWSMEQGVLVAWLKQPGEMVRAGEPLFTLEGDKAVEDIDAQGDGILHVPPDAPHPGDTVAVGAVLGYLLSADENASQPTVPQPADPHPVAAAEIVKTLTEAPAAGPAARRLARELGVSLDKLFTSGRITVDDVQAHTPCEAAARLDNSAATTDNGTGAGAKSHSVPCRRRGLPLISPRAARIAAELGIDWTVLSGTGGNGRIREADVCRAAAMRVESPKSTKGEPSHLRFNDGRRVVQPSPLRRTIAQRMRSSLHSTAPVTLTVRCDATRLVALRKELKSDAADARVASYTDIIAKLTAAALGKHPLLNARWEDERIVVFDDVHLGIAVDTDEGLLVPVVRDVRKLTLGELARRSRDLVERARARRVSAGELEGGTFTITNLGGFGIEAFAPIINYPQTAILGVGAILREATVLDDSRIEPRDRLTLSLTFDHQVLDGAGAARFLQTLRGLLESPLAALLD